jgi:predicted nuclease with RNAse H fold
VFGGVDVGGRRKGFHAAVLDARSLVAGPKRLAGPGETADWLAAFDLESVGVDSPCRPALPGQTARHCERELARRVCGVRWTPAGDRLHGNPYYEWIVHGLELYEALRERGIEAIEVFPTASFTRWTGLRSRASRAAWSHGALDGLGLGGLPPRLGQDGRDAIAAAFTAQLQAEGAAERFGEIWVPA